MSEQYWIGGIFIDLSRNQITQNKQSQVIAPKALAVLTCLAENQGKVVSHDELLLKVWQGTVVSTNTLQRSIAQLRKALGDDGKGQVYIKTHAKQGYSLECDVRWSEGIEPATPNSPLEQVVDDTGTGEDQGETTTPAPATTKKVDSPKSSISALRLTAIIFGIVILGIIGYQYPVAKQTSLLSFGELRALTSTDNKELASIYSPDGEYVVFHRYSEDLCINNVWAKNIKTQQEYQLTENLDSYGSHSFSKDGSQLVFIKSGACTQPVTQKKCYKLMSLDFNKALVSPQSPSLLTECKNTEIRSPRWLDNNNIFLLQKFSTRWKLITYSVSENTSQDLYVLESGNVVSYDFSAADDLIALTSFHSDGHYYIDVLKTDGQLLSSHRIKYPEEIARFRLIFPKFSPLENQLIFSTGRQLFTLSYEGEISNISLPLDEPMGSPTFHPDGKRMIVIKGRYDSDIASVPLSQVAQGHGKKNENLSVMQRSILAEDNALLQPNGELIAYRSERSGDQQIWIANGEVSQQLTRFPMDTFIRGMQWAADGKSLLVSTSGSLKQVYLDSRQKDFQLDIPVVRLFQWDSNNNTALLLVRLEGIVQFVELNLSNSETRVINDRAINWASKSKSGQLIYKDRMDRFWRPGAAEDQLIEALEGQGGPFQRFLISDNVIYGINDDFQLWSYALDEERFEIIGGLPASVDNLTDISQSRLLMTVRVSSNKEVVELYLKE